MGGNVSIDSCRCWWFFEIDFGFTVWFILELKKGKL